MAKQTAAKARPALMKLANEKRPSTLSEVKLYDRKQARAALAAVRGHSLTDLEVDDSDLADFLTTLGASLFAQATPRVQSRKDISLLDISDHEKLLPVHKNVHRLRARPSFFAEISVPSHVVAKGQTQPVARISSRDHRVAHTRLMIEKWENAEKMRQMGRMYGQRRVLTRLRGAGSLHAEPKREKNLLPQTLLGSCRMRGRFPWAKAEVKIVVVGAGLAGLSAADQLLSFGFTNVVVLEALDRVGGRIHSVPHCDSQQLEMGVSCVDHANNDNSVYSLVKKLGLPEESCTEGKIESVLLSPNGLPLKADALHYISKLGKLLSKDAHLIYWHIKSRHCENIRLAYKDYIRERCRRLINNNLTTSRPAVLCQMANGLHVDTEYRLGDDAGDLAINLLGFHQDHGCTKITLPIGMSSLLVPLTVQLKCGKLKLHTCVQVVQWRVSRRKDQPNCRITCSDGRLFYAHHVIIAIPLGHLKENADKMFKPSLPTEKSDAIKRVGFGTVTKVYLCYEDQFWSRSFSFIWPGTERDSKTLWSQTMRIASLDGHPKTVEVVLLGDACELIADADVSRELTAILRLYFNFDIPPPVEVRKSEWYSNFLFRGTHPYLSTQCSEGDVSILGEPLICGDVPVVLFAGDYTHTNYSCLTHAARFSGLREAHRLQDLYNATSKGTGS